MSVPNDYLGLGGHLADGRLSTRATMYYRWLDGRYAPLDHPLLAPSTSDRSQTILQGDHSQRDAEAATKEYLSDTAHDDVARHPTSVSGASEPGKGRVTASQSKRMDIDSCFAVIIGQVAALAAKNSRDFPEIAAAINEATPLRCPLAGHPFAWSIRRKWVYTFLVGLTMFNASFASTAVNGAGTRIVKQYGLSQEEMVFITGSFIGGCVAGPVVWAPLSEIYGRRPVCLASTMLYSVMNIGCALAPSKGVLFASRFLAGAFASSAFSNAAAVITDLFAPPDRARPMIVASLAPLLGPCFGPLFGALVSSELRWPFVFWLLGAIGLLFTAALFCVPETYQPVIAARSTPKDRVRSSATWQQRFRVFVLINLGRPINMMCREPIVVCATFYLSLFFSLMYLFFVSWPLIFGPPGIYRLDTVHTGITFLPMAIGGLLAAALLPLCERYYRMRDKAAGAPVPEARLLPTFFVAPLVAAGLVWAGWLARTTIPYEVTMLAGIPIGAAMVLVFQGWISYLGDCYRLYSSSAIAATVIGRSISGATIPLATHSLHEKLGGIAYLYTLLAGLVILTSPIPYLVFRFGDRLRARSMYKPGRA